MLTPFAGGWVGKTSGVAAGLVVLTLLVVAHFLTFQLEVGSVPRQREGTLTALLPAAGDGSDGGRESAAGGVPACARDVIVALRGDGDAGAVDGGCFGLLLRDDLVLTSRACSRRTLAFDFVGFGAVAAIPHAALRAREDAFDPRLGFLEARPPHHYRSIREPVRRARAFLSGRAAGNGTAAGVTCGDRGEPVARSWTVDGRPIPLGSLRGVVPEDVLWEETDLGTAAMLEFRSQRWWARPVTRAQAQETMKEMLELYRGPPGSISFPFTRDDFTGRAAALCETVDPRGHRLHNCFLYYLRRWRREEPFSGLPFLEWLDFGPGKFLLESEGKGNKRCRKSHFNRDKVHYFTDEDRRAHEVDFAPAAGGSKLIARYKRSGEAVPNSGRKDPLMYMWDLNENFYMVNATPSKELRREHGAVKHSGIVAGAPALSGGVVYTLEGGEIWGITFSSGHYRPDVRAAALLYQWMKGRGFNLTSLFWIGRMDWSTADCRDADWEGVRIPGFGATALNRSCHEVMQGPKWIQRHDV